MQNFSFANLNRQHSASVENGHFFPPNEAPINIVN